MADDPARALLLAAGRGERLGPRGREAAKCLLGFGGRSLLERHLRTLQALSVPEVVVVTGYRHADVVAELERCTRMPVEVQFNPRFERGSIVSLWHACDHLRAGGEVLLMDADVLYAPEILARLCEIPGTGALLDRSCDLADPEPVKLCVRAGRIAELSKSLPPELSFDRAGESVGFFRLSERTAGRLADEVERRVDAGRLDEPHEHALRSVLLADPEDCQVHDITGLPWIEIDFARDLERAEREILPRLWEPGP